MSDRQVIIDLKKKLADAKAWVEYMAEEWSKGKTDEFAAKFLDRLELLHKRLNKQEKRQPVPFAEPEPEAVRHADLLAEIQRGEASLRRKDMR